MEKGIEKGMEKGEEKKTRQFVENLLAKLDMSDEKAAEIAEVSVDYVKEIRSRAGL